MSRDRVLKALKAAARPTLKAMRADRKKLSPRLRPLITYVARHLFEPSLNATKAWAAAAANDHSLSAAFKAATGHTLRAYIERRRLEVADRMLMTTDFEVGWISWAVGYEHHDRFASAYSRWLEELPSEARRKPRPQEIDYLTWRRSLRRELDLDSMWKVQKRWLRLYPEIEDRLREHFAAAGEREVVDGARHVQRSAAGIWWELRELPFEEQRRRLRRVQFRSTALFDLLREESRKQGRKDRRRGIELARLALESLEASADAFGELIHDLRALGWAWLGNAYVLALDLAAADAAFEKADAEWGVARAEQDDLVLARICNLKGTLRMFQRRYDEALKLVDRARSLFQFGMAPKGEARALIQRAAILGYCDEPEESIVTLEEAKRLLEAGLAKDTYLVFTVTGNLANILARLGRYGPASDYLAKAKDELAQLDLSVGPSQLLWIEGDIKLGFGEFQAAGDLYVEARRGFADAAEWSSFALTSLDLAILASERRDWDRVVEVTAEAVPILGSARLHPETLAAVDLLAKAVHAGHVRGRLLRKARELLQKDPLTRLA